MRSPALLWFLLVASVALPLLPAPPAPADEPQDEGAEDEFTPAPDPATATGPDAELFRRGLELQQKGSYRAARKVFWKLVDEHPDSPFRDEAEDRSGDRDGNAFLGVAPMHDLGPPARRIDVALMGDGYVLEKQDRFEKAVVGHLEVLMGEQAFAAYRPYFNFYRFSLASREDGVDEVERAPPDDEAEERRRTRRRKRPPKEFSTALDCKAEGPQGQVWANPSRVWHYLTYLKDNDGLAICFAQKGQLGMGGMGIATTGPKGVVIHEFGHAFSGLLDEYQNNPGAPAGQVEAANATTNRDRPPWQHFLDQKIPGVGVFEGGATFVKGVWRPAASCAMNVGGSQFCPVCKEATVLMIYTYVSPVDEASPGLSLVRAEGSALPTFSVLPMQPATHDLEVTWFLDRAPDVTAVESPSATAGDEGDDEGLTPLERRLRERQRRQREGSAAPSPASPDLPAPFPFRPGATRRNAGTGNEPLPSGKEIRARRAKGERGTRSEVTLADLAPGRYLLTAVVRDPARPKGAKHPWVLKDERGLLEDRVRWTVEVLPPEPR